MNVLNFINSMFQQNLLNASIVMLRHNSQNQEEGSNDTQGEGENKPPKEPKRPDFIIHLLIVIVCVGIIGCIVFNPAVDYVKKNIHFTKQSPIKVEHKLEYVDTFDGPPIGIDTIIIDDFNVGSKK